MVVRGNNCYILFKKSWDTIELLTHALLLFNFQKCYRDIYHTRWVKSEQNSAFLSSFHGFEVWFWYINWFFILIFLKRKIILFFPHFLSTAKSVYLSIWYNISIIVVYKKCNCWGCRLWYYIVKVKLRNGWYAIIIFCHSRKWHGWHLYFEQNCDFYFYLFCFSYYIMNCLDQIR